MIIMPRNETWSDLTARQKAPFVIRGIVQVALLAAALTDIYRRPAEEIRGGKWLWGDAALPEDLTSRFVAQTLYGIFLSWKIDAPPPDWREARDRYFRANVVCGLGSSV